MEPAKLTPQDQATINKKMTLMETKDIALLKTANSMVDACFRECANGFTSSSLDKKEKECVSSCATKYMEMMERVYRRYQELHNMRTISNMG